MCSTEYHKVILAKIAGERERKNRLSRITREPVSAYQKDANLVHFTLYASVVSLASYSTNPQVRAGTVYEVKLIPDRQISKRASPPINILAERGGVLPLWAKAPGRGFGRK